MHTVTILKYTVIIIIATDKKLNTVVHAFYCQSYMYMYMYKMYNVQVHVIYSEKGQNFTGNSRNAFPPLE